MGRLFGTDGVRGLANRDVTAEVALDVSVAAGAFFPAELNFDNYINVWSTVDLGTGLAEHQDRG
ncbi:MAG: hypothetical protein J0I87_02790, partial [Cellulomonas sp.]|nr:hypothetical protein [Cellulomonas sp.]